MMFFENTRALGIVFWIVSAFLLLDGILLLTDSFDVQYLSDLVDATEEFDPHTFSLFTGIGSIVAAVISMVFSHKVMMGRIDGKLRVLAYYVAVAGLTTMAILISEGIGVYAGGGTYEDMENLSIYGIVYGLILILISLKVNRGKKGPLKMFLWCVLMVAFIAMAAGALSPSGDYSELARHTADLLISIFLIIFLLDDEVRRDMGFKVWRLEGLPEEEVQ